MANEGDFLELLVASERVEGWLSLIKAGRNASRVRQAVQELAAAVEAREAYAEEVRLLRLQQQEADPQRLLVVVAGGQQQAGQAWTAADWRADRRQRSAPPRAPVQARLAGAVPVLTQLLKRTEEEELLELAAEIIAACSGPMATADKVRTFCYDGTPVVIREGALGDGVGAKIWTVAHTLCRELAAHPEIVRDQEVLEIGSGCGACGILAAKLGARQVLLTDYLEAILTNLRACVHLNSPQSASSTSTPGSGGGSAAAVEAAAVDVGVTAAAAEEPAHAAGAADELFDPEDASECSDLDDFFSEAAACQVGPEGRQPAQQQQSWDVGNMHVRFLDWSDSVTYLQRQPGHLRQSAGQRQEAAEGAAAAAAATAEAVAAGGGGEGGSGCGGNGGGSAAGGGGAAGGIASPRPASPRGAAMAPGVDPQQQFGLVLGTDILYEWPMVEMVACVLKHRLAPGGRALLCCAVREQAMFDAFTLRLRELGFRLGVLPVQPKMDDGGILGKDRDYEGGFVMMALEHAAAPAAGSWHRDDLRLS